MPHQMIAGLMAGMLLGFGPIAIAQDQPEAKQIMWAEMFFWSDTFVGLMIIWVLLILSALSIGFTIKLTIQYRKKVLLPEEMRSQIQTMIGDRRYREALSIASQDASYLGKLTGSALSEAANGYGAMERAIEETGNAETTRILRPIEYLNVLGNIAPMMGLFGTVYGMIVAFQKLVSTGGNPDPVQLAGGISTALVTTFWGLVVAIPALAAYALIRNKVDSLTHEGIMIAEEMISTFKPRGKQVSSEGRSRATPKPEG